MAGLPEGGKTPWPPKEAKDYLSWMGVWSAWYKGDPDELSGVYGGGSYGAGPTSEYRFSTPRTHPNQYRGGLAGTIARMWWGKPTPPGDFPQKLHVPAAEDLAAVSSMLLFAEPPRVTFEGNEAAQKRWDDIAARSNLHAKLLQGAEVQAALGGVYMVVTWDTELADYPWLRPVHADCAYPEFRWDKLTAVTFWQVLEEDKSDVWRHLERHEPGRILHGLYRGDRDNLGNPQPLAAHPKTAMLQPQVPTVEGRLTAAYVPNALPNRLDRGCQQGRSDYSPGVITLMDALDETYTSLMNDLDLGKARLIVPDSYLASNGPGQGGRFESDRRIFSPINTIDSPDRPATIEQVQFAIRFQEHLAMATDLMSRIVQSAGYSSQAVLGDDSTVQTTATEVSVKDRKSHQTRDMKALYWGDALETLIETLLLVDAKVFSSPVTAARPTTEFGEQVQDPPLTLAQTAQALMAAEAASIETRVRTVHPGWEDPKVKAEVEAIKAEIGTPVDMAAQAADNATEIAAMRTPPPPPGGGGPPKF